MKIFHEDILFIKDNFFIISNDNSKTFPSHMYGVVIDDGIYVGQNVLSEMIDNQCPGEYINIINTSDFMFIQQDFYGLYNIFLYNKNGFYAISNSLLYLINYLRKNKHKLTIDYNYAKTIISTWTSLNYSKTIIKEIEHVPHFYFLKVDKKRNAIEKIKKFQRKRYIDISTSTGMSVIDDWHHKWGCICNSLIYAKQNLMINVTGGCDSRAALSVLFQNSKPIVNVSNVNFETIDHHTLWEDKKIATEIGNRLGFSLNTSKIESSKIYISDFASIAISLFSKSTIHNQFYFDDSYLLSPCFHMGGHGGEFLRDHWNMDTTQFIRTFMPPWSVELQAETLKMFERCFTAIRNDYHYSVSIPRAIYECCRGRNHFGTFFQESFLHNYIGMYPLFDPCLSRLKMPNASGLNHNLLFAIIYERFLKEIIGIPFDSNNTFSPEIWEMARIINERNKLKEYDISQSLQLHIMPRLLPKCCSVPSNPISWIYKIFNSSPCMDFIQKLYSRNVYYSAKNNFSNSGLHIDELITSLISVYITIVASSPRLVEQNNDEIIDALIKIN